MASFNEFRCYVLQVSTVILNTQIKKRPPLYPCYIRNKVSKILQVVTLNSKYALGINQFQHMHFINTVNVS